MKKAFHRRLYNNSVEDQRKLTAAIVTIDRESWTHGSGAETIHTLTDAFEMRPENHVLYLGADFRVLGETMKDIREAVKRLHKANVAIYDLSNPNDTLLDSYNRAQVALRWNGDRRSQKNKGRKGGTAKGIALEAKRNSILARDIVIRMCAHPKLTLKDCAGILGAPFSESTLRRNYRF